MHTRGSSAALQYTQFWPLVEPHQPATYRTTVAKLEPHLLHKSTIVGKTGTFLRDPHQ
jgi:hypothetical protein